MKLRKVDIGPGPAPSQPPLAVTLPASCNRVVSRSGTIWTRAADGKWDAWTPLARSLGETSPT